MGSLKKLASGIWSARVQLNGRDFKRRFKTKGEAQRWMRQLEIDLANTEAFVGQQGWGLRLKDLMQQYRLQITPTKKGALQESALLLRLEKQPLADKPLLEIQPIHIVQWREWRLKAVSPATVIREMNMLSSVFNVGRTEFCIIGLDANPVQGVKRPKAPLHRDRRFLEQKDEMERVINATESPMLKLIIPFAVETGMRRGEIANLTWDAVSLEQQTARLEDANVKNGVGRSVPLSRRAVEILRSVPQHEGDTVFDMKANSIGLAFRRAVKRARKLYEEECYEKNIKPDPALLKNLRLHDLRHEAASRFFEVKELSVMEVASITGHKDLRQLRRYTHLSASKLAKKLN